MAKSTEYPVLYHYTSLEAAASILSEGKIRLHRSTALSDPMEVQYGVGLYIDILFEAFEAAKSKSAEKKLCNLLLNAYHVFGLQGDKRYTPRLLESLGVPTSAAEMMHFMDTYGAKNPEVYRAVYIASFSEERDALSQWRLYGGAGAGIALGFALVDDLAIPRPGGRDVKVRLGKVTYDPDKIRRKQRQMIERMLSSDSNIWAVAEKCYRDAVLLKQPDYAHENEWRLYLYAKALKHSPAMDLKSGRPRPFVELCRFGDLPSGSLPVVEVRTGPKALFDGANNEDWRMYILNQTTIADPSKLQLLSSGKEMR